MLGGIQITQTRIMQFEQGAPLCEIPAEGWGGYSLWAMNGIQHITSVELDTMLKVINLALQWQTKVLH